MTEAERQLEPAAELLRSAAELSNTERVVARERFLQRVEREVERPRRLPLGTYVAPLTLAAAVLLVVFLWQPRQGLEYTVVGAVQDGNYVRVAHEHPADITFPDHSRIKASPGARLRIDEGKTQNGARVSVERGRLEVDVVHTERSDWHFVAGPFRVRVTGTRFAFAWDAEAERLEVVLHEGSVDINGYASGVASVQAGQRFVGDAKRRSMLVMDVDAAREPTARPRASATPQQVAPVPTPSASGSAPSVNASASAPRPTARTSWPELVSKGSFRQVVDEATARGTSRCLASCSGEELSALADAARYVGRSDLAEQALMALRRRHASSHGVRAAFLLGRLHERRGSMSTARSWYETTLREGGGGFSAEALAGKMRTVNASQGREAARSVAREYLRLYPRGVHAETARQLVEGS